MLNRRIPDRSAPKCHSLPETQVPRGAEVPARNNARRERRTGYSNALITIQSEQDGAATPDNWPCPRKQCDCLRGPRHRPAKGGSSASPRLVPCPPHASTASDPHRTRDSSNPQAPRSPPCIRLSPRTPCQPKRHRRCPAMASTRQSFLQRLEPSPTAHRSLSFAFAHRPDG